MKNLLQLIFATTLLLGLCFAETTPISSIQDVTGLASDESPMVGQVVTIQGIVSAESWAYGDSYYFVQDAEAMWSGIMVYDPDRGTAYGDEVQITATVAEYSGVTELTSVTEYVILDSLKTVNPIVVTTGEIGTGGTNAEAYEGVLVKIENANITNADAGYGQWMVDDGSGEVMIDDAADYYFDPSEYSAVTSLVGPLHYAYGDHKILPRGAWDIVEDDDYVRLQRVQQVRYSDLLRAFWDSASDTSYMVGDTVTVKGIVTMPTGLSYAGDGIKFIFQEEEGGPWSSILSYNSDSTAYPVLFEGDLIEMTGYIDEYSTGSANMTEFFITSPINILNFGLETPTPDTVLTGDLRQPATAEQWGNNMVVVKDAVVIDVDPGYEMFSVDDGSGEVLVDDDSDDLAGYDDPSVGAIFSSIEGWVYHHYGAHVDYDTYKLCPLYTEDLVYGGGPPTMTDATRSPMIPQSMDNVDVSVGVSTNGVIANVTLSYRTNNGQFVDVDMADNGDGSYTGTILEVIGGDWIEYFIKAVDTEDQSSLMPADTSKKFYGFTVADGDLSIADIQYSPWETADSPFDQASVEITGIVTVDSSFQNLFEAYMIQDDAAPWSGIALFGVEQVLTRGDEVKVYGTVEEYNADWNFKWDNNTCILVDSVKVLSSGNDVPAALIVTTGELADDAEPYEGVLVKVEDAQVTELNSYDWTIDDGSGAFLLDDDCSRISDWFAALEVGSMLNYATGPVVFSFGTYKIEPRDLADVEKASGIADDIIETARSYKLEQNFPNPFNPETRIYFEVPTTEHVTIAIFNVLGQKVRTLESANYTAGRYTLNWDGKNSAGVSVPTGTYFYRMKAGSYIQTRKMLLMK